MDKISKLYHFIIPLAVWAGMAVLVWPGAMTNDSFGWLIRARSGAFSDVQPIGVSLLWQILDHLYAGPFLFVVCNIALIVFAADMILNRLIVSRWVSGVALGGVVLYPPVLTILGVAWRDVTGLGVTFVTALVALSCLQASRATHLHIFIAIVLTLAGCFLRYNHAAGALPFLIVVAWYMFPHINHTFFKFISASILATCLGVVATACAIYVTHNISAHHAHAGQVPKLYMLSLMSFETENNLLPQALYPDFDLDLVKSRVETTKNPYRRIFWRAFTQQDDPMFPRLTSQENILELNQAYKKAIKEYPVLYVRLKFQNISQWLSFSNDYSGGTLRQGFANLETFSDQIDINFPTEKPLWSYAVLEKMDSYNESPIFNNPLYILVFCVLLNILFYLYKPHCISSSMAGLFTISAVLHFLGVIINVYAYEFRYGHQSIALSAFAIIIACSGFLQKRAV